MSTGRTVTKQLRIETRQHELLGFDMGEGVRRKDLILGLVIFPAWLVFLWLVLGAPTKATSLLYILPPMVFLKYGITESERMPRRMNFTQWILAIRYGLTGHRPIVRAGARRASRNEYMPLSKRWNMATMARLLRLEHLLDRRGEMDWHKVAEIPGLGFTSKYVESSQSTDYIRASGKPIDFSPAAYLYSNEELVNIGQRMKRKQEKRKKQR